MTEDDLLAFIAASIGSVWALELLLLFKRDPDRSWDPEGLIRELRSSPVVIGEALKRLLAAGLIMEGGAKSYRYQPASPQVNELVSELERAYVAKPMTVIKAIAAAQTDKLRSFSDAFKLKD